MPLTSQSTERISGRVILFPFGTRSLPALVVERALELVELAVDDRAFRLVAISAFVLAVTFGPYGASPVKPSFMLP